MTILFYSKKECPFCWQVKIALSHYNIAYKLTEWKVPDKEFVLKFSPQGSLPVIVHNTIPIWDSIPIIYYLEDISTDDKTLLPGNSIERNKARLLHTYSNAIVGKGLREVIFEKRGKSEKEWDLERIKKGELEWEKTLDWLEAELETEHSFLSAGFSISDASLLPRFGLAEHYGAGVDEKHPRLHEWFQHWKKQNIYLEAIPW